MTVPTPPAAPAEAPPHRPSRLEVVKDNLEAFAVAIVMALVIKHFCVEAFKIPSGSMIPTLMGNEDEGGDRILVDKLAYLLHGPRRWDVVVFRYPLDESRNFIKRFLGLPGETLKVVAGDLWVRGPGEADFRLATKRRRVREQMYENGAYTGGGPVWPQRPEVRGRDASEPWESGSPGSWRVESFARIDFAGGSQADLRYVPQVTQGYGNEAARDVRFRARVVAEAPASLSWVWRAGGDVVVEVRVSSKGFHEASAIGVNRGGAREETPVDVVLEPGRPLDLEAECVDGEWIVSAGGEEAGRLSLGLRIADARDVPSEERRFTMRASGGALRLDGFAIDRDLCYTAGGMSELGADGPGVLVPEDNYFAMGDNTKQSSDSRGWTREGVVLKDGREIFWDGKDEKSDPQYVEDGSGPPEVAGGTGRVRKVVDVRGVERWWNEDDEVRDLRDAAPFVRRELVVGRAFFVFWPILPGFPGRVGFIN